MGVMPPVSNMVDDSRFTEFSTSMMARASGAPGGTRPSARPGRRRDEDAGARGGRRQQQGEQRQRAAECA
jgi:hypothetical protein